MFISQEVIMADCFHHNCNFDPCRDTKKSGNPDIGFSDVMELIHSIPEHYLKVSTTMHGTISDPERIERVRELIKKLK